MKPSTVLYAKPSGTRAPVDGGGPKFLPNSFSRSGRNAPKDLASGVGISMVAAMISETVAMVFSSGLNVGSLTLAKNCSKTGWKIWTGSAVVSRDRPGLKYPSDIAVLGFPCNLRYSLERAAEEGESAIGVLASRRSGVDWAWEEGTETYGYDSHACIICTGNSDKESLASADI